MPANVNKVHGSLSEERVALNSDFPSPVSTWLCRTTTPTLDGMPLSENVQIHQRSLLGDSPKLNASRV